MLFRFLFNRRFFFEVFTLTVQKSLVVVLYGLHRGQVRCLTDKGYVRWSFRDGYRNKKIKRMTYIIFSTKP